MPASNTEQVIHKGATKKLLQSHLFSLWKPLILGDDYDSKKSYSSKKTKKLEEKISKTFYVCACITSPLMIN